MDEPSKQPDEIYCPECAKPIKKDFTICPYCRTEIKNLGNEEPEILQSELKENEDNTNNKWKPVNIWKILIPVILILGVLVLFISCVNGCFNSNNSNTPTTKSEQSQKIEALVGSQSVVQDSLKSPSSAKFPSIVDSNIVITKVSTDKYSVSAYVDSENSFGAMIRTYYTCTVTLFEDRYKVEDLKFSE